MSKKLNGLGKGLDALFLESKIEENKAAVNLADITKLRISDIEPDKNQPRKNFSEEAIKTLADSIAIHGVLQPIVVRSAASENDSESTKKLLEGKYRIVSGERRWRASKLAGLTEVPVVIKELTDSEAGAIMLVENLQREDLNPVGTARGLKRLIEEFGLTHEETAKIIGISRPNLTNCLRLLSLPDNVLDFIESGDISAGHARTLIPLEKEETINEALDIVLAKQLSVRETERLVKNMLSAKELKGKSSIQEVDKQIYLKKLEECVASKLGRKASICAKGSKGAGKLEIQYYSSKDLEELLMTLCGKDIFDEFNA